MPIALTAAFLLLGSAIVVLLKERKGASVFLALGIVLLALVEVFDSYALRQPGSVLVYKRVVVFLKSLMPVIFLLYTLALSKRRSGSLWHLPLGVFLLLGAAFATGTLLLPMEQFFVAEEGFEQRILPLAQVGYWFYLGLMILCIVALVNLEAALSSLRGADRWRMKFELLGVGSILAGYIFYFSQGLLYRSVNMNLLPVRSSVLIVAALMIGYSRIFRGQTHKVEFSRQVFYRSFTVLAVGLYLIVLGLLGEGMKRFQVPWSLNLTLLVAFGSGLLFLVLLLSEAIRGRVRVFVAKHFYAHKHDYREQWLGFSNALAACRSLADVEAAVVETYRRVFGLRFAALYLRESAAGPYSLAFSQGREGLPTTFAPSDGLSGYFTETGRVLNPRDGECTPTPEDAAFLRQTQAWLLVPLVAGDQVEALVLFGPQITPDKLTYEDFDLMKILGRQAVLSLNNYRLTEQLAESREMAAAARLSAFVAHDLKNLVYSFSLMLENADAYIGEPDFQRDMLRSIRSTVGRMNELIGKLRAVPQRQELRPVPSDLCLIAAEAVEEARRAKPSAVIAAELAPAPARFDASEMRKVALNLVLNACDATGGNGGRIEVRTGGGPDRVFLAVRDEGVGMAESFVADQLFKPFRTTKEKGLGIGLYQSKQIVEAHGGRIEVSSRLGSGSHFEVFLPKVRD